MEFVIKEDPTYEIDFDKVQTVEDIKIILQALDLRFDERFFREEIARFLKNDQ